MVGGYLNRPWPAAGKTVTVGLMTRPQLTYFDAPVSCGEKCHLALHQGRAPRGDDGARRGSAIDAGASLRYARHMTIRVIGAGYGRTGTDSLREALNILGFGPCHHMREVNANEEQRHMWRALVQGAAPDWERLLAGYASCVDWPSAYYWRELMDFYPEAKVILTYRTPESWWKSYEQTILVGIERSQEPESLGLALIRDKVFGGRAADRAHVIAVYEQNVKAVTSTVPPERLLVHGLGDGWEPLCAHLGVPVPGAPYPSRNTTSDFRADLK
jgi:hypothetical protein